VNNYEFCANWVLDQENNDDVSVLDYGCGAGGIVKELRNQHVNAYGCDVFYEGGDCSKFIEGKYLNKGIIKAMDGDLIPYEDASFDYVISNTVMEHVENLAGVLAEIKRVLKPGGVVLSIFPDKSVWREGHCGIFFLHWFPKGSRFRVYYAAAFRFLGFGHNKGTKGVMCWSEEFCDWLDKWTHYRTRKEINSIFSMYFSDIKHIEDYWLQLRLDKRKRLVTWLPISVQKLVVNKFGGVVFIAYKKD